MKTKFRVAALRPASCAPRPPRSGLTLVEMLVSLVCVLMLMMAYTQLFSDVGSKVGEARSMIELTSRMRAATQRLHADLEAHTCDMRPWQRPEAGAGYFEYIEGPLSDKNNGLTSAAYSAAGGTFDSTTNPITNYPLGDTDDVLMFTVRSKEGPYTGRYSVVGNTSIVQSQVAEVVWFLRPTLKADGKTMVDPPTYTLYRRVFLVMPTYSGAPTIILSTKTTYQSDLKNLMASQDISGHVEVTYDPSFPLDITHATTVKIVGNTLGDLTKRENRFAHSFQPILTKNGPNTDYTEGFPHPVDPTMLVPFGGQVSGGNYSINPASASYSRYGEDVVLTNVLSFDVQAWDPTAPVYTSGGVAFGPCDKGFPAGASLTALPQPSPIGTPPLSSLGAYVDLNWMNVAWTGSPTAIPASWLTVANGATTMSPFYSQGHPKSQLTASFVAGSMNYSQSWLVGSSTNGTPATFDTWSFHYEMDGISQVPSYDLSTADPATNQIYGITSGSSNYETSPPYPVPLRGIQVRIRCYEPDARDVREVTVTESFVPD